MESKAYYHIHRIDENHRWSDPFLISDSVAINEKFENFYFHKQIDKYGYGTCERTGPLNQPNNLERISIFTTLGNIDKKFPPFVFDIPRTPKPEELYELEELYSKSTEILQESNRAFRHTFQLLRELIFEEVRLKNFSNLPSRKNCIWICEDEAQLKDWIPNLGLATFQIMKVEAVGNIFKTDSKFISTWELDVSKYYEYANQYWNPTNNFQYPEVLFTGELRILERFDTIEEIEFDT